MEYFYGGGGNSNPDFVYRYEVKEISNEMWKWCEDYPLNGPFERWHVQYRSKIARLDNPVITFENKNAAFMFSIAFSEYIIADRTYSFARDRNDNS